MKPHQAADWFGYEAATPEQATRCVIIRSKCAELARLAVEILDDDRDQEFVLRKLKGFCESMICAVVKPYPAAEPELLESFRTH